MLTLFIKYQNFLSFVFSGSVRAPAASAGSSWMRAAEGAETRGVSGVEDSLSELAGTLIDVEQRGE